MNISSNNSVDDEDNVSRRAFIRLASATLLSGCAMDKEFDKSEFRQTSPPAVEGVTEGTDRQVHQLLSLNGRWSVVPLPLSAIGDPGYRSFKDVVSPQMVVNVPGEIHLDLIRAQQMLDPNVSDNARTRCRWPETFSWWYQTDFDVPAGFLDKLRQVLVFDGVDLFCQVFMNGRLLHSAKDAFTAFRVDLRGTLKSQGNELVVRVTSGMELLSEEGPRNDDRTFPWPTTNQERSFIKKRHRFLRKPAYSAYGWDSCDALPNIGIWRGVRLEGHTKVALHHVRLDTVFRNTKVLLEGEIVLDNLHPWSEISCVVEVLITKTAAHPVQMRIATAVLPGRAPVPCQIEIPNAELWWPNTMGDQPLYNLMIRVLCDTEETDRTERTIGLRVLELDRTASGSGSGFRFKVNGEGVYCKGGGWAAPDLIAARIGAAKYERLIQDARAAHVTMLRINGYSFYEDDKFYDACDRAGILIWQDFPFTIARYPDTDPDFMDTVRTEAEEAIKRLQHHPCLAVWCGNNECAETMSEELGQMNPSGTQDIGGVRIYNDLLPTLCASYDPHRPYIPSSPIGGAKPNGGSSGDRHAPYGLYGLVESGIETASKSDRQAFERRWQELADTFQAHFVSEFGIIGPPNLRSVQEYLKPDEISRSSVAWGIHTNSFEESLSPVDFGIECNYGDPQRTSIDQFILYGQMYQAQLIGGFVEAMRFKKNDPKGECQGVLNWSFNDTWGEVGWSLVDYYLRRKASYYWFKHAATPVKVLVRSKGNFLVTRIVNDTLKSYDAMLTYGWIRLDGTAREVSTHSVRIPPNGMIEIYREPRPSPTQRDPKEWLYAATLAGKGFPFDQTRWMLAPYKDLSLVEPSISVQIRGGFLEVSSPVYCHGVHLEEEKQVLLDDSHFDLLPGIVRYVPIVGTTSTDGYQFQCVRPLTS